MLSMYEITGSFKNYAYDSQIERWVQKQFEFEFLDSKQLKAINRDNSYEEEVEFAKKHFPTLGETVKINFDFLYVFSESNFITFSERDNITFDFLLISKCERGGNVFHNHEGENKIFIPTYRVEKDNGKIIHIPTHLISIEEAEVYHSGKSVEIDTDTYLFYAVSFEATPEKKEDEITRGMLNNWRNEVLKEGKCACCGGEKHLEAHHIFSYNNYEHLRDDVDNGIALCRWCHRKFHSYYGKETTPMDLYKFLNRFGIPDRREKDGN